MKVGNLVEFKKTGAMALIIDSSDDGGYTSFNLQVFGGVLAHSAMRGGTLQNPVDLTWMTEHMLKRVAEVVG
tara:strand:- start:23 stop:238 length:216 start_codon:yes stop_codon:yes gene_type:complete